MTTNFRMSTRHEDTANMDAGWVTVEAKDKDGASNWREVHTFRIASWCWMNGCTTDHDWEAVEARAAAWIVKAEASGKTAAEMRKEWAA